MPEPTCASTQDAFVQQAAKPNTRRAAGWSSAPALPPRFKCPHSGAALPRTSLRSCCVCNHPVFARISPTWRWAIIHALLLTCSGVGWAKFGVVVAGGTPWESPLQGWHGTCGAQRAWKGLAVPKRAVILDLISPDQPCN